MLENLEMRHLVTLRAVAETGTFAKAATRLGYTQSAISQQVASLERMVGSALFDRPGGPKKPVLTPAGRLLLEHAEGIEKRVSTLSEELEDLAAGRVGRLVIGTFQSVSAQILPEVIIRIKKQTPDITIELQENLEDSKVAQLIDQGEVDMAFLVNGHSKLEQELVLEDRYLAVSPLAMAPDGPTVSLEQLVDAPLIGMPVEDGCQIILEKGFDQLGVQPKWVYRTNDNGTLLSMARAGLGRTIVPQLAIDSTEKGLQFQGVVPELPIRKIYLARAKGRTLPPVAEQFWEEVIKVCTEISAQW